VAGTFAAESAANSRSLWLTGTSASRSPWAIRNGGAVAETYVIGLASRTLSGQLRIGQPSSDDSGERGSAWQSVRPNELLNASHAPGSMCSSIRRKSVGP
jgi:hypothetical protein